MKDSMEIMKLYHPMMYKKLLSMTTKERETYARAIYKKTITNGRTVEETSLVNLFIPENFNVFLRNTISLWDFLKEVAQTEHDELNKLREEAQKISKDLKSIHVKLPPILKPMQESNFLQVENPEQII